jgi:hypothetical protein
LRDEGHDSGVALPPFFLAQKIEGPTVRADFAVTAASLVAALGTKTAA